MKFAVGAVKTKHKDSVGSEYECMNNGIQCCVMLVGVIVGGILNVTVNETQTGRVRLPCRALMAACASALL